MSSAYRPQYTAHTSRQFSPKKVVRSFRDLDVYRITIECATLITKDVAPHLMRTKYPFADRVHEQALSIPLFVAEAHSIRFADFARGVGYLEKAMASCNKMTVYLEHTAALYSEKFDIGLIDELIKRYADARGKMFRLEKAWKKFRPAQSE